jgi:hypothetical protein
VQIVIDAQKGPPLAMDATAKTSGTSIRGDREHRARGRREEEGARRRK